MQNIYGIICFLLLLYLSVLVSVSVSVFYYLHFLQDAFQVTLDAFCISLELPNV